MKKILLIHHCGIIGGAGVSLYHILKSIDKSKYDVTILCPKEPSEIYDILKKDNFKVIASETSPKIFNHYNGGIKRAVSFKTIKNIFEVIIDRKNIDRYIEKINPDIVAVNSMTLCWIGEIAKKRNKKTICFHRETYQKGILGLRSLYIKKKLAEFDEVVFISKNDLLETGKINGKSKVIYDKVLLNKFNTMNKKSAKKLLDLGDFEYILYLGGMSKLKGANIIVEAMKYLKKRNVKLIFIGEDNCDIKRYLNNCGKLQKIKIFLGLDYKYNILKFINKNGLGDNIEFRSRTTTPELYFNSCDVIVFPSTMPHQSRPIYEAGIAKIPIIITEFKETTEFAIDGVNSRTFKNGSSVDLAEKIEYILDNTEERKRIIENNYNMTVKNHNFNSLKSELQDVFDL